MHKLYHHSMSVPSRYARLILGEYGQQFQLVEETPWSRKPDFLKLNPAGTLPVLATGDGRSVCGGTVVGEFIDETVGAMMREKRLMPENSFDRAEIRRLVDWFLIKFETEALHYIVGERVFKQMKRSEEGGGAPDSSRIRAGRNNLKNHLKYIGWLAGNRNWLGGTRLSHADMAAAAGISVLDYLGEIDWDSEPAARDWYARIKSRPSFRPLLADKVGGIPPVSHYADLDF